MGLDAFTTPNNSQPAQEQPKAKPIIRHFSQIRIFCVRCNKIVPTDMHIINDLNTERTNELRFDCAHCGTLLKIAKL